MNKSAILTLSCADKPGLVSRISGFIHNYGGNIISLNEFVDSGPGIFYLRIQWTLDQFKLTDDELLAAFQQQMMEINASWEINFSDKRLKLALFVSKYDHCLRDILYRHSMGEFEADIPLIISNHSDMKKIADRYSIDFYYFPINKDNKKAQEEAEVRLLQQHQIHTIILARYMQILSPEFVALYPNRIINIHHSFLPAFIGGNPYRQAFERGVKIIGATSHFVTSELDEGPIIVQETVKISHRNGIDDLIQKGRDLERMVLSKAVKLQAERRVLVSGNKTVVFE
ncbi:MAG: formyltetrahydrofolate deformylase [Bacteroidales bacterium]|nr:formyltetrahydrofolate deformylase [Bacteroidales bacterium]MCF8391458.1 formyltetrahydrofolate deformylase [Bacteroidales bacterium]